LAESVNALYKKEVIAPNGPWNSVTEVISTTSEWVYWYDNERLYSWCGNVPPSEFEEAFWRGSLAQHPGA
jgi:transposase InsO family protein